MICFSKQLNEHGQEEFEYMTEFQAHSKGFDTLSSSEITESITGIEWINN